MKNFVLINIRDEKQLRKYQKDRYLRQSVLLPYYEEGYICFSSRENYSFEELTEMFLVGDEAEQIGSVSIIAEYYPDELYRFICDQRQNLPSKKVKFILDFVIPSYLPIALPKERLMDYELHQDMSDDIWVKILLVIRTLL